MSIKDGNFYHIWKGVTPGDLLAKDERANDKNRLIEHSFSFTFRLGQMPG